MPDTILRSLTEMNPVPDSSNSLGGSLSFNTRWPTVESMADWADFNYNTLIACYGTILQNSFQGRFPEVSPPLSQLECEIWDEDSLDHMISRAIIPQVSEALRAACATFYPGREPIDITRGGRARKANQDNSQDNNRNRNSRHPSSESNPDKAFPDWAAVKRGSQGGPKYVNCCPGDTKLSTKWASEQKSSREYFRPIAQVLFYAGNHWGTRYGYVITQDELVVLRFSREEIGPGLAAGRPRRAPAPSRALTTQDARAPGGHHRVFSDASQTSAMSIDPQSPGQTRSRQTSVTSTASSLSELSLGVGSVYDDSHPNLEYKPVEYKSIPWENSGPGRLTVKLALWWIHMMAAEDDISIKTSYPPLDPRRAGQRQGTPSPPRPRESGSRGPSSSSQSDSSSQSPPRHRNTGREGGSNPPSQGPSSQSQRVSGNQRPGQPTRGYHGGQPATPPRQTGLSYSSQHHSPPRHPSDGSRGPNPPIQRTNQQDPRSYGAHGQNPPNPQHPGYYGASGRNPPSQGRGPSRR
ncbi:hypothetical protein FQN54_004109 [Arachnomyces sp. PD_36]|nr:hypothetical protein FQN54_004109 [Arachnomyces sp. PD_36]